MSVNLLLSICSTVILRADKRVVIDLTPHDLESPIQYTVANTFNLAKTGTLHSIDLTNSLDRIYTGTISIGTPATQSFNVVFDTGSADLWIFSAYHTCETASSCSDDWNQFECGSDDVCCFFNDIMNDYDHDLSSTYSRFTPTKEWSITYGKGSASGYLSQDSVTIGGLVAETQIFAEATSWSDLLISCYEPMSGILGFAMKAASEDGSNTVIENLYNQNMIESKLFSVALKGDDGKSKLIIGEPDTEYYRNDIVWGDVIQPSSTGMWFTQLTGIVMTQSSTLDHDLPYFWMDECQDTEPCLALIDTGTSYITMPSAVYNKLVNYLVDYTAQSEAKCIKYNTDFMCSTKSYSPDEHLPFLWFQLGGYGFQLAPSQYMLTGTDSCAIGYDCMGISFLDSMGDHTYILGDTFLREYYLVFDESNYQIGLGSMDEEMSAAIPRPPVNELWKYIEIGSYVIGAIGILVCVVASCWKLRKSSHFWAWRQQQQEIWRKEREQLLNQSSVQSDRSQSNHSSNSLDARQHYQYQAMIDDHSQRSQQSNDSGLLGMTSKSSTNLSTAPSTMDTSRAGRGGGGGGQKRENENGNNSNSRKSATTMTIHDEDYRSRIRELRQAFLDSNVVSVNDEVHHHHQHQHQNQNQIF